MNFIQQSRKELGINYTTYQVEAIRSNILKLSCKNEDYTMSNANQLDEEIEIIYQYYLFTDEFTFEKDNEEVYIVVENQRVAKLKKGQQKILKWEIEDQDLEIMGGNYKKITYKDEDPYKVVLTKSKEFKAILSIKTKIAD